MRFDICTLFPDMFTSYLSDSILKRARDKGLLEVHFHNIRDYSKDKHKKVDDTPYGGGAGMLMTPQPLYDCITSVKKLNSGPVIFMTPQGQKLTHTRTKRLARSNDSLILLCGRYEGIDERIRDLLVDKELSIGDYVLTGGELAAMVVVDAVSRFIPGVLGDENSAKEDSFSRRLSGKKEYPHYTKPAVFKGLEVPEVLRSGNHAKIEEWRKKHLR
ncbi:tRNA (guanosine(37)-N1)-methyltransferase TrmD [Candidatus Peregrinibacteria bacterium]|nr:tRNA (guanosine(37)-N1)-methyltransferase TrmD [Candidatus Peregrinibacteria bacterium]